MRHVISLLLLSAPLIVMLGPSTAQADNFGLTMLVSSDGGIVPSFTQLAQLVASKGHQESVLLKGICQTLRVTNRLGQCLSYQAFYTTKNGYGISFNVVENPLPGQLPIILIIHNGDEAEIYLTSTDERLVRAIHGKKHGEDWSWHPISIGQATPGFNSQVKFWHVKQGEIQTWPDR